MIKPLLTISLLFLAYACTPEPQTTDMSDDYVLIEFAARLEEDYARIYPEPLDNIEKKNAE